MRIIAALLAFSVTIVTGSVTTANAKRQEYPFPFPGLRAELRSADAIVHVTAHAWVPDSSLGIDPESKTWYRVAIHVTVSRAFGDCPLRAADTLTVSASYSRLEREFRELEEKTQQFIFTGVPALTGSSAILLLKRTNEGWEATRALYPDDAFVDTYVGAAGLSEQAAGLTFIRLLLKEFLNPDPEMISPQIWGHIRVLEDDLDRMGFYEPEAVALWRTEANARADDIVRVAGSSDVRMFVQLALYLPESRRRECVRRLVCTYDSAVTVVRRLDSNDKNPQLTAEPELTAEMIQYLDAAGLVAELPEAMRALTPPDKTSGPDSDARVVARARRYAFP